MKESISYTYLLNMMLIFIVISFSVMMMVFSYTKAYRLGSKIASALEEAEGYNELSKAEISRLITNFGYQQFNVNCGETAEKDTIGYCLYEIGEVKDDIKYIHYKITTYMLFDLPVIGDMIRIPVKTETERIACLGTGCDSK